eukprot:TRINITY_DN17853_c0_g1_i1.p1 TRINITY_DN17853_c0_g1~~TRINITY_DN17853_c0_g1_i1.p1  ORF type:complete len:225 (+),score=56.70 TRINITY_DN17853_c0_g1_i1:76-675(+)
MVVVSCPGCGGAFDGPCGSTVSCPHCGALAQTPPAAPVSALCPACRSAISGPAEQTVQCPYCGGATRLPAAEAAAAAPPPQPAPAPAAAPPPAPARTPAPAPSPAPASPPSAAGSGGPPPGLCVGSQVRLAEGPALEHELRICGITLNAEARAKAEELERYRHDSAKVLQLGPSWAHLMFSDGSTASRQQWPIGALRAP